MVFMMLLVVAVVLFIILDWIWFKWIFEPHMNKIWWIMALIALAAGKAFSGVAQNNADLEWTIFVGIILYVLAGVIVVIGIGKKVNRSY